MVYHVYHLSLVDVSDPGISTASGTSSTTEVPILITPDVATEYFGSKATMVHV